MKTVLSTLALSFLLSAILIGILCTTVSASEVDERGVRFLSTPEFKEIQRMAAEQNKPIFIDFTADWCGYCRRLDKQIFQTEEVARFMNESYINYKVDVDEDDGARLAMIYKIWQLPTLIFAKPNGEVIMEDSYYYTKEQFLRAARKANDRFLGRRNTTTAPHVPTPAPVLLSVAENSKASIHAEIHRMGKCSSDGERKPKNSNNPKNSDAYIPELETDTLDPTILHQH